MAARTPAGGMHVGLPAALLLLGFLVSAGVARERVREREEPQRRAALERIVRDRQRAIRGLARDLAALHRDLEARRSAVAAGSGELRGILREVETLEAAAGAGAVRGPGLTVVLRDSDRPASGAQAAADLTVQDVDLQMTVNALWRAGAEAVALNGSRVASTTAIRSAGGRVLVNFEPVVSPYRIEAIGDPVGMRDRFESSEIARRFEVWAQVYHLGFAIREANAVRVPALPGGGTRFARPVG